MSGRFGFTLYLSEAALPGQHNLVFNRLVNALFDGTSECREFHYLFVLQQVCRRSHMTYRAHLDQLVTVCTLKGKAYLTAKREAKHSPGYLEHLKTEWEQAEDDFEACLALIMSQKVRMHDPVRDQAADRILQGKMSYSRP